MAPTVVPSKDALSFGSFRLIPGERLLTRQGDAVELGARALDILIALVSRPNEVISKKELLSHVWPDVTVEESSLRFHIASLRKALGDGRDGARYITTLAGRGYCFVAPVARTRDEIGAVLPVAAEFPHANLPGGITHIVGREEDILNISTHVLATRFVSIVGGGGVGKTTVAVAVGHHLFDSFAGAVLLVDLGTLRYSGLVATAVASELGLSVQSEDATPAVVAYLRTKRMLIILDTCEHLTDAVAALASQIYAKAPDVHILATSREVLQVHSEHVYRLDTLACPPEDSEAVNPAAQTFPAPRLFIERAAASGARLDLSDTDVAIVVRICRKLDGVALAIELAARRVETYGLQETETLLDQRLLLLLGHRGSTPRQRTLQATLDWSYQLLSDLERMVLRRLAVFCGHFTLDAALAVATGNDIDQAQVFGAIDSLVAKSMIITRPLGAMMRYRLLDTTRAYVLDVAIDDAEATALAVRHATYYGRWLEQSSGEWQTLSTGPERSPHFAALNNARSALEWCFGEHGDGDLGVKLAAAAAPAFLAMSLLPECYRWSQRAIMALDDRTRGAADEMQLQACLGVASMHIHGPNEAARAALNKSLAIAEARGNFVNQVEMLRTLSLFYTRQGEFKIALDHAKRARAVARAIKEPDATAVAQSALGMALHFVGDHGGARLELEAAFQHWSSTRPTDLGVDDRPSVRMRGVGNAIGGVRLGLARTLWAQGFPAQAIDWARQTVEHAKLSSNPASLAVTLSWVPGILVWVGDLRSAEELTDRLIAHAEAHSLGLYLSVGHGYKGMLSICRGNAIAGVETLQEGLKRLHAVHYESRNAEFKIALTEGLIALGRVDEAMVLIDETISRVEESGELYLLPETLRMRGRAFLASSKPQVGEAEACFLQSLEWSRRQGARAWELRAAIDLARFLANRGKPNDARKLLQPVLEQFTEGQETGDLQTAERLLTELGRINRAKRCSL